MDLERVIDLFEAKHTSQLSDRHAAAIQQLCSEKLGTGIGGGDYHQNQGFYYKELPSLARVIDHCFAGI
jgi:hypothetical protein